MIYLTKCVCNERFLQQDDTTQFNAADVNSAVQVQAWSLRCRSSPGGSGGSAVHRRSYGPSSAVLSRLSWRQHRVESLGARSLHRVHVASCWWGARRRSCHGDGQVRWRQSEVVRERAVRTVYGLRRPNHRCRRSDEAAHGYTRLGAFKRAGSSRTFGTEDLCHSAQSYDDERPRTTWCDYCRHLLELPKKTFGQCSSYDPQKKFIV